MGAAARTRTRSARGGALVEVALTTVVLVVLVSFTLSVLYLHFTRAWLEYASEQALYCLSEGHAVNDCRRGLKRQIENVPFVRVAELRLVRRRDSWKVNVRWLVQKYRFQLVKTLNARRVLSPVGLRS